MQRYLFLLFILILSYSSFAQKIKTDTVFYDGGNQTVQKSDPKAVRYQVIVKEGKFRLVNDYLVDGTLLQTQNFIKNKREGSYFSWNPKDSLRINGHFKKDKAVDKWGYEDFKHGYNYADIYDKNGLLVDKEFIPSKGDTIYEKTHLDKAAQYKTGQQDWLKHLLQNINYPKGGLRGKETGGVNVRLTILSTGRIADGVAMNADEINKDLVAEAIRVAIISEGWNPGIKDGKPVNSYLDIRIVFSL